MFSLLRTSSNYLFWLIILAWLGLSYALSLADLGIFPWELQQFLLGKSLHQGFSLYKEVKDNTAPLGAFWFYLLDLLGLGMSNKTGIAAFLILFQAILFHRTLKLIDALNTLGYFPFFLYLFSFLFSRELLHPSPALLGLSFLILAWREVLIQQKGLQGSDRIFRVGLYLGLAFFCFLAYGWYLTWALLALSFYASINTRQYLLLLFGYFLVILMVVLLFSFMGNMGSFAAVYRQSALNFQAIPWSNIKSVLNAYSPMFILGVWGLYLIASGSRLRTLDQKLQQTNVFWVLFTFISLFTIPRVQIGNLVAFVPGLVLFASHVFVKLRSIWWKELILASLILAAFISNQFQWNSQENLLVKAQDLGIPPSRVMVLGDAPGVYLRYEMAGPIVNWPLAQKDFEKRDAYEGLISLAEWLEKTKTDYIYDPLGLMPSLRQGIPSLKQQYRPIHSQLYQYQP